jgi:hypothetical protein
MATKHWLRNKLKPNVINTSNIGGIPNTLDNLLDDLRNYTPFFISQKTNMAFNQKI